MNTLEKEIQGVSGMEFVERLCNTGLCSIQDSLLKNGLVMSEVGRDLVMGGHMLKLSTQV